MLVLTRKPMQQIRIGNDITVTVVKVERNTIRIAIEAPREVHILRGELEPFGTGTDKLATESLELNSQTPEKEATSETELPLRRSLAIRRDMRSTTGNDRTAPRSPAHPQRWTIASMRERTAPGESHRSSNTGSASPLTRTSR